MASAMVEGRSRASPPRASAVCGASAAGGGFWRTLLWAVVVVSCVAGVFLRFAASSPLWLDEALSVNIASLAPGDVVDALRHDGHPMLYYLTLGVWLDAFGDSDFAARALSGLCSTAAALIVWAAARRRLSADAARFAGVLALTSPFLIRYGGEARMYALVVLIAALGWLLTELTIEQRRRLVPIALAMTVAAGLHTHYWMIWLTAAASIVLTAVWLRQPERRQRITPALVAYGCGWLAFAPWLGVLVEQAAHTGTPWGEMGPPGRGRHRVHRGDGRRHPIRADAAGHSDRGRGRSRRDADSRHPSGRGVGLARPARRVAGSGCGHLDARLGRVGGSRVLKCFRSALCGGRGAVRVGVGGSRPGGPAREQCCGRGSRARGVRGGGRGRRDPARPLSGRRGRRGHQQFCRVRRCRIRLS